MKHREYGEDGARLIGEPEASVAPTQFPVVKALPPERGAAIRRTECRERLLRVRGVRVRDSDETARAGRRRRQGLILGREHVLQRMGATPE